MKHLKHLFTALLLLCTTVATAHDFQVGGIYYNITDATNKTVAVTFGGDSYSHYSNEYSGSLVIPESVTYNGITYRVEKIEDYAFAGCYRLSNLKIPNSVTSVGAYACWGCTELRNVTIGNGVTSIGESAFTGCYYLSGLTIPNSVITIGDFAFNGCYHLYSVTIPNSVTSIGDFAFNECPKLTQVTIGYGVTKIGHNIFSLCDRLANIIVEEGNTKYDSRDNCNAVVETETNTIIAGCKKTTISNSITAIGEYAFYNCSELTSITIPNSVISIGDYAFCKCIELESITIPNSVTSIGDYAFSTCNVLKKIYAMSKIPAYIYDNTFYNTTWSATLYVPYGAKETYASTAGWSEFANIVEITPSDVTITINQYGSATYCSPYALDFSNVEGLKAYAATGYKSNSQVVTLTRVQTAEAGVGLFLKGESGEYVVPVIESTDEHSLNMLVGTLEQTTVNSTEGEMSNYKFTIAEGDDAPMFYPFEDGTTLSAGKAYLQIPTAWLPATAQKSLSVRFDDGETTDIDELKGEDGELKGVCFDLQGRVVENPTTGIYIIDGKKVFIK